MGTALEKQGYMADWDLVADLEAWEGYEYWSTQLEAKMESLNQFEMPDSFRLVRLERTEVRSDVLPF